jgi:hypothetical protein
MVIAYRDKKVVGVFVRFFVPLQPTEDGLPPLGSFGLGLGHSNE